LFCFERLHVASAVTSAAPPTSRWQLGARIALAGPVAVLLSVLIFAGMPLWLPRGAAGIDHIVMPLILLPAVWAVLFFHAVLDRSLARVALVAAAIGIGHVAMLAVHFAAPSPITSTSQGAKQ
jgi:hypothetical protein